jgi:nucleoside phosphorylase
MLESGLRRAVILTAIPVEYQTVCAHLANFRQETNGSTIYGRGDFIDDNHAWDILVVETGMGTTKAAAETVHALEYFQPDVVLFVGVAGGLKDVKIGDVVAATKVYGYEFGKSDPIFRSRPDVYHASRHIEQRARSEARKQDWLKRLKKVLTGARQSPQPQVHLAPIASGNQVIASTDSEVLNLLRSIYNDAVAVEMEGYGFLEAVHAYPCVDALIVRGISDLIDDKAKIGAENFQQVAAHHAAAFAFEVLAKLGALPHQAGRGTGNTASHRKEQPYETQQSGFLEQGETLGVSPEALTEELLRGFRVAFSQYAGKIQTILNFVDARRNISPSWCKSAIRWLNTIDEHIQRLRNDAPVLSVLDRVLLVHIHDQIRALKLELLAFRRPRWFTKVPQRQLDENAYERISTMCKALLTDLEQFNQKP